VSKEGLTKNKVEAPIVNHLRDLGVDGEEYEVVRISPT